MSSGGASEVILSLSSTDADREIDLDYASLLSELREAGFDVRFEGATSSLAGTKSAGLQIAGLAVSFLAPTTTTLAGLLVAWKAKRDSSCQLNVDLPNGQSLQMPLTPKEAREMLNKHLSAPNG
jgi:hypothetical protein